jgi:hypothetical protein
VKPLAAAAVAFALLAGVAGGLVRAGVLAPWAAWQVQAAVSHAALMMGAFFGTVIGIERAVAAKRRLAWASPLASAAAGFALVAGVPLAGALLLVLASAVFFACGVMLWRRERAMHTLVLAAGGASWFVGNAALAAGMSSAAVLPWWFGFLIVTIAGERLEMTRLMRPRPLARGAFVAVMLALAIGAALSSAVFGIALFALALWLMAFDIARRTVRAPGLTRYMAIALLTGYAWLAIGGLAWAWGARDAALHALGLGFVASMVMAHAPVILPAVAGIAIRFTPWFYVPLAILDMSLAWRLGVDLPRGALGNAIAIALFAATVASCAGGKQKSRP